jgi:hypothetical protein
MTFTPTQNVRFINYTSNNLRKTTYPASYYLRIFLLHITIFILFSRITNNRDSLQTDKLFVSV